MRHQHSTDGEDRQCRRIAISSDAHRPAAFGRRSVLIVALLASSMRIPQADAREAPSFGRTQDHVHVTARQLGHADTILITLSIDPGYHVNANPASEDYLIPTSVAFAGAKPEHIDYPPSIPFKPAFSEKPINVYEGRVVIAASFPPGTLDRTRARALTVTAQACTDRICLPPAQISATVE